MKYKILTHEFFWDTDNGKGIVRINTHNINNPGEQQSFTLKIRNSREVNFYMNLLTNDKYLGQLQFNTGNKQISSAPVGN